jgi:hypothetical protein
METSDTEGHLEFGQVIIKHFGFPWFSCFKYAGKNGKDPRK